jgi:acetoin utilization deacetylase AcuC-like enzyme
MRLAVVYSDKLRGDIPATSKRFVNAEKVISTLGIDVLQPDIEEKKYLLRIHSLEYVERARNLPFYEIACESMRCVLKAGEAIKEFDVVVVPTSATGHLAERERMRGYSVFNDIAALVEKLRDEGYRIAVIETDAHHGNSAAIIEDKAYCLCIAGEPECKIKDDLSCFFARDMNKEKYVESFGEMLKLIKNYDADVIVWYLGQDLHVLEYSEMNLDNGSFAEMIKMITEVAKGKKMIILLASGSREDVFENLLRSIVVEVLKL